MIYNDLVESLEYKKQVKDSGKFNSIVLPFERFSELFGGFEKGKYGIITASSGIGKTKITKFLTIISLYKFCYQHKLKFKVKYFALEESETDFWLSFIAIILHSKYNKTVTIQELKSLGNKTLGSETLKQIKEIESIITDMMNYIKVYDYIFNGFGIFKEVRDYARNNGKFYFEGNEVADGKLSDSYKPNDPDEHVFIIVDHISLLSSEKNFEGISMNHWESLGYFSKEYALKNFCKKYNYTYIGVQQQESSKEKQEYTNKGASIIDKIEPSLDGLATNKELQREADWVFGLFAPDRYKIEDYRGYDITQFKDCFRALIVLKDRHYGTANSYIPLFMNGVTNEFFELPKAADMSETKYREYLSKVNK